MKLNRFVFSAAMLIFALHVTAADSTYVKEVQDSSNVEEVQEGKYDKRVRRAEKVWASLIPTHFVIQNAGNMGVISAGIGWSYGKRRQWETELLFGYIPKHDSSRGKLTTTLKGNFIPWDVNLTPKAGTDAVKWQFQPLTTSLYLNTVYGHEFWKSQPGRYPDKYYEFMSTKFRLNIALGQRFTWHIPLEKRKGCKSISFFYEISTCDLYVRSIIIDSSVPLKDIIGLSLGIKLQTL